MSFAVETHERGILTKKCDAILAAPYLLVKEGTDVSHVAVTAANTDKPLGFIQHATDAIEDIVSVALPGKGGDTKSAVAAAAITHLDRVVPSSAGRVEKLPTVGGTYWVVGIALQTVTTAGDAIEINDCVPYPVVVT